MPGKKKKPAPRPRRPVAAPEIVRELETAAAARSGGGSAARISMSGSSAPRSPDAPRLEDEPAAPVAPAEPELEQRAEDALEKVFSPEVTAMLLETAFGVAAVATGEPEIWRATDDEIRPLAPGLGRQLSRIPVVRAVGPDNTELGIVVLGLGVMVTRRLNETAEKIQHERRAKAAATRAAATETAAPARPHPAAAPADPAAPAAALREDGEPDEHHFGMRVN
jgi:hypothetical protein